MTSPAATLHAFCLSLMRPAPAESPTDWALKHVIFDEKEYHGPFTIDGAEYLREPLDEFASTTITDSVECWGSQTRKTSMYMAGSCWTIENDPSGIFWVMPTRELARSFSSTRLRPCLKKTVPHLIPKGRERHLFNTSEMTLGAAGIRLTGGGSAAALSSTPARRVLIDEVEKLLEQVQGEADAVDLAEQRAKNALWPQRRKTSSPALATGLIWQQFLRGDQRRYFIPCPGCGKSVVLAWSKQFTVFRITGDEAFATWDKEAKRKDGTWDEERVSKSARYTCPHCAFHIRDGHRAKMNARGEWRPTAPAPAHLRSRHLPSLYSCAPECSVSRLALRFLEKKTRSLLGLQGFINGDLAEPYSAQETRGERIELITKRMVEVTAEWKKLLTADCQAKTPHFWYVVRAWNGGNSEGLEFGSLDTWEELRAVQLKHGIPDVGVVIDSGYGAKSEAEVYQNCARFGEGESCADGRIERIGWMPAKGMAGHKRWKNAEGIWVPFYLGTVDPYQGTSDAAICRLSLFEFSSDFFQDILENLRARKAGYEWRVSAEMATDEYWTHLDGAVKQPVFNKLTGRVVHKWVMRGRLWPDHGRDCEKIQVAAAAFYKLFELK